MKIRISSSAGYRERIPVFIAAGAGIIFLAVALFFTGSSFNPLWLLPPAMILLLIALVSLDKFLLVTIFFVPLSVQMRFIDPDIRADLFLPTEIMLPVILILVLFKALVTREIDRRLITHPVAIIGFLMLLWSLITSFTGTMPLVSLKSSAARLWFFTGFFLLAAEIFKKRENIERYFKAYLAGMVPVVLYFISNMWHSGLFDQKATFHAVRPFFNDHTAIGASLAFCIPVIMFLLFKRGTGGIKRFFLFLLLALFSFAFVLSYSRAAWISLAIALLAAVTLALRMSWKLVLPAFAVVVIAVAASWSGLVLRLSENRQASSGNLSEHIRSISNIRTDDSNMERINRWNSALRMAAGKPLLGWGPATYQFKYAPFQAASEKTAISTNYGEGGNAHSEYFGALTDSGIPGMMLFIVLVAVVMVRGINLYKKVADKESSLLVLAMVSGLITYIVHGALNNFLDSDKISALFWGMIAAIVSMEIANGKKEAEGARDQ